MRIRVGTALFVFASVAVFTATQAPPVPPATTAAAEWRHYHRDLAGTRYSPLEAITPANVTSLAVAWRWKSDNFSAPPEYKNESTPLMIGGTLYFTTGSSRWVIAADAATGATRWTWRLDESDRAAAAPRRDAGRGVSYWTNGTEERIFTVTPGFRLVALDARTGRPVSNFGRDGVVDLKSLLGVEVDAKTAAIGNSSPPLVFEDIVVIGPALEVGTRPPSYKNVPGRILAVDARTGALKWRFNTIPQKGEEGYETWEAGSAEYTGNAGAWAPLSLDEKRGYLYLPLEAATGDYYGGHRLGANLFSSTLACLDVRTGRRLWHFQTVHHDIWDWDNPTAPILADVTVDGQPREIVVQLTKQSFAYVLDRVTGKPIWPIDERPVPASDVPGERAAATQPFPSKPKAYDRQGVTENDLIDFTPELRAEALKLIADGKLRMGAFFAPPSLADAPDGTKGTLSLPGNLGGTNWEHGAFDPETGMLYVGSWTNPTVHALIKDTQRSDMNYVGGGGRLPNVRGLPIIKPPHPASPPSTCARANTRGWWPTATRLRPSPTTPRSRDSPFRRPARRHDLYCSRQRHCSSPRTAIAAKPCCARSTKRRAPACGRARCRARPAAPR
ncbi:MAG: PQQ-binding-like beta-propeller repeat protein [Acidobacteria bacterium]|nr:PQQ-binding-like beta-propeller repeat protein [Acidobacteriota bacterium]